MNIELYIARKISFSDNGNAKSPAVGVATIAVALSFIIMLVSIAVVLGFKDEIRSKVVGFNSNISVYAATSSDSTDNVIALNKELKELLDGMDFIKDYGLQVSIPAVVKTSSDFKGIYLKGVNSASTADFISGSLKEGIMPEFSSDADNDKILVSHIVANQLNLNPGDKTDVYFIGDDIRVRRLEIAGVFSTHFDQYDKALAFGSMNLLQKLGGIDSEEGTFIEINVDDFDKTTEYANELQAAFKTAFANGSIKKPLGVETVISQGESYFNWLSLLDTNVVVILVMMIIVGCVTLISGMLIIIIQKKRFIGMMKSLGAKTSSIRKIFIYLTLKICVTGLLIGNIVGLSLLAIQERTHILPLDPESYYIDFVPARISFTAVVLLTAGVMAVSYFVLILPSQIISRISPGESMRYE